MLPVKKKCPWKSLKNLKKVPVKRQTCPWNFTKIMPVKLKLMHVKKFGKISRENSNFSSNTIKFVPVKINFLPVKKTKKNEKKWKKCPWKKKVGVKKLENRPKSGREIVFLPVKKSKKRQKMAFTGTFFFTGKKNTASKWLSSIGDGGGLWHI